MSSNTTVNGIDVSHFQENVNWQEVKAAGIAFAFAKATDGGQFVDPFFAANWQGMKDVGILRGAYHFFESGTDPVTQATHFIATVGSLSPTDLPPVLDIESCSSGGDGARLCANVQTWLDTVQRGLGRMPMIYTDSSFWNKNMSAAFGHYPLWIAEYGVATPRLPNGWSAWNFWQSSQTGTVAGVGGSVDVDAFAGTYADLLAFIQAPATACAAPAATASQRYTVQSGNTLSQIAAEYGLTVAQLAAANQLQNVNAISVGEVLLIPSATSSV